MFKYLTFGSCVVLVNGFAQEAETCEGFNELTGDSFPFCDDGFICEVSGQITIPGAGYWCVPE